MKKTNSSKHPPIYDCKKLTPIVKRLEKTGVFEKLCNKYSDWYTSHEEVEIKIKELAKECGAIIRTELLIPDSIEVILETYMADYYQSELKLHSACFVEFTNILWCVASTNPKLTTNEGPCYISGRVNLAASFHRSDDLEIYKQIRKLKNHPDLLFSKDAKIRNLVKEVLNGD